MKAASRTCRGAVLILTFRVPQVLIYFKGDSFLSPSIIVGCESISLSMIGHWKNFAKFVVCSDICEAVDTIVLLTVYAGVLLVLLFLLVLDVLTGTLELFVIGLKSILKESNLPISFNSALSESICSVSSPDISQKLSNPASISL